MKILVPTADYPPIEGGISTVALRVSRALAAMGHEVTVIAPYFPGMRAFDESEPAKVVRYRGYHTGWLRFIPMAWTTRPHLQSAELVLGINVAYGGVLGCFAARRYGTPFLAFAYAYEFLKFRRNRFVAGLLRTVYAEAEAVVSISTYTSERLAAFGVDGARIRTLFPGAPEPLALSDDRLAEVRKKYRLDTPHVLLSVGRFVPRKGHITLVRAMPAILERYPDAVLVLAGRGPALYGCMQEVYRLGIREQVLFPGCVSDEDLAALYQICEVFALPAGQGKGGQVEGFGLVFVEAGAYGKPVVAGRSGGVVDAVLDGETGLIVEPDRPDELARALLKIMDDPAFASELGERGKRRVETELNWTRFTERMMNLLVE